MATPRDNTEVIRMLKDFKNAVYKSATPLHMPSPAFGSYSSYGRANVNLRADASQIATRLNFSNLDDTTKMISQTSSVFDDTVQTPEVLKRKLACAEVELQASKAALKAKESVLSMMEPSTKKVCLSLEQKLERSEKKSQADKENVIKLENKLKYALNDVTLTKNRIRELENEKKIECDKLHMKILGLQQECSNLKQELSTVKSEKMETVRKLNNDIGRLELKNESMTQESTMLKEFIQSLKQQVAEWTEKATSAVKLQEQLRDAQLTIKTLEDEINSNKEKSVIVNSLESELKQLPSLRKENQQLKEELTKYKDSNVPLFQEKMWSLQEKLSQAEKKNLILAKVQVENEQLKSKLVEWESLFDDSPDTKKKSPMAFSRRLSHYQKNETLLTNKLSKLTAHCDTLEKENKDLKVEIDVLRKNAEQIKANACNYEPRLELLNRRIIMLTRDRDSCRKLIESYISETALTGSTPSNTHIKNLEENIMEYKNSLEKADAEIDNLSKQIEELLECRQEKENNELENKLLKEEKSKLLARLEQLAKEKNDLEAKLSSNNKDAMSKDEKIIHLRCNPFSTAVQKQTADLKSMRDENDRLKKRIKVLEEEGTSAADITAKVEEKLEKEGSETQLKKLTEQLAATEYQNKMIIETARTKSREFREAVYSLTGYKIDVPMTGKYKLSHVYAESQNDYLLFEFNQRNVDLLETEYSKNLTKQITTYLQGYDSVPAFLASVTLDLFSSQTHVAEKSMI